MNYPAFSTFKDYNGKPLSKNLSLKDGKLDKESEAALVKGYVERKRARSLENFCKYMTELSSCHAVSFGVCDHRKAGVLSQKRYRDYEGNETVVTRTGDFFSWPDGPGIMLLDYDPPPGEDALQADKIVAALRQAVPELNDITIAVKPSVSSCIHKGDEELAGIKGQHLFLVCNDASRIPEIGELIHKRLWLAGHAYIRVSGSGNMLERSLIDTAVWQPERLVFGSAHCAEGLEQRFPEPLIFTAKDEDLIGERWLDPDNLPPLSEDEQKEVFRLIAQAKAEKNPEADKQREIWIESRAKESAGEDATPEELEERKQSLRRAVTEGGYLPPELILYCQHGETVTVADIKADPDKWNGVRFADPLEPDYGGDDRIAMAILTGCQEPYIYSHAHGGMRYFLRSEEERQSEIDSMFEDLTQEQTQSKKLDGLKVINPADLQGKFVPERQWIVKDWIPRGHVTLLYGDGGTGKSLLAMQLMTAAALGREWLGIPIEEMKSLGFFCEDDPDELHARQEFLNSYYKEKFTRLSDMRWYSGVGEDNTLMSFDTQGNCRLTKLYLQIEQYAMEMEPGFIIIDTAADTFDGDEIKRRQVRIFVSKLTKLAQNINAAILLCAHPSRDGMKTGRGDGGSTAWSNRARSRLYLKGPDKDDINKNKRTLSREKSNYAASGVEIEIYWSQGAFKHYQPNAEHLLQNQQRAQDFFLKMLDAYSSQNRNLSDSKHSGNYAPKLLSNDLGNQEFNVKELENAMNRLFNSGKIINEIYGRKSQPSRKIVRTDNKT